MRFDHFLSSIGFLLLLTPDPYPRVNILLCGGQTVMSGTRAGHKHRLPLVGFERVVNAEERIKAGGHERHN
jgi:hypothetical protein